MNRKTLLIGFFLAVSLGAYIEVAPWRDAEMVAIKLGPDIFNIPERNSLEKWLAQDPFGTRSIPGLRPSGPAVNLHISAEEMAQLVDGYQVADGKLKANIVWLVEFLDEQALSRLHAPDQITNDIWHQKGHMEHSVVSPYKGTRFYKVHAEGDDVFWKLTRMPPQPDQPLPPKFEFWAASCIDGKSHLTGTGRLTSCSSVILHQNLLVTFHTKGFNLHLVDEIEAALVRKLEEWRAQPVPGS